MNFQIPGAEPMEISEAEREKILDAALLSRAPLKMRTYPAKFKRKLVLLDLVAKLFEPGRVYSQNEVNAILGGVWWDPVTLRRDLVELGWLDRERDGSAYWMKTRP